MPSRLPTQHGPGVCPHTPDLVVLCQMGSFRRAPYCSAQMTIPSLLTSLLVLSSYIKNRTNPGHGQHLKSNNIVTFPDTANWAVFLMRCAIPQRLRDHYLPGADRCRTPPGYWRPFSSVPEPAHGTRQISR